MEDKIVRYLKRKATEHKIWVPKKTKKSNQPEDPLATVQFMIVWKVKRLKEEEGAWAVNRRVAFESRLKMILNEAFERGLLSGERLKGEEADRFWVFLCFW